LGKMHGEIEEDRVGGGQGVDAQRLLHEKDSLMPASNF